MLNVSERLCRQSSRCLASVWQAVQRNSGKKPVNLRSPRRPFCPLDRAARSGRTRRALVLRLRLAQGRRVAHRQNVSAAARCLQYPDAACFQFLGRIYRARRRAAWHRFRFCGCRSSRRCLIGRYCWSHGVLYPFGRSGRRSDRIDDTSVSAAFAPNPADRRRPDRAARSCHTGFCDASLNAARIRNPSDHVGAALRTKGVCALPEWAKPSLYFDGIIQRLNVGGSECTCFGCICK